MVGELRRDAANQMWFKKVVLGLALGIALGLYCIVEVALQWDMFQMAWEWIDAQLALLVATLW